MANEYITPGGIVYQIRDGKIKPRFVYRLHVPYTESERSRIMGNFGQIRLDSPEGRVIAHKGVTTKEELEEIYTPTVEGTLMKTAPEAEKYMGEEEIKEMREYNKAAGLDKSKIDTIAHLPIVLVAIAIGVLVLWLGRVK